MGRPAPEAIEVTRLNHAEWDDLRRLVYARDSGCIARKLQGDEVNETDAWGMTLERPLHFRDMEFDHVQEGYGRMAAKAEDRAERGVSICSGHHRGTGNSAGFVWATANRPLLRTYLDSIYKPSPASSESQQEARSAEEMA